MGNLLTSWKEIAVFFGKSVRTVQRWEVEHQLPVQRPNAKEKNLVLASVDDLKEWMNRRAGGDGDGINELSLLKRRVAELEDEIRQLKLELQIEQAGPNLASTINRLELLKPRKSEFRS
jgi:hypothetical protein